jgi:hypothetical protein
VIHRGKREKERKTLRERRKRKERVRKGTALEEEKIRGWELNFGKTMRSGKLRKRGGYDKGGENISGKRGKERSK